MDLECLLLTDKPRPIWLCVFPAGYERKALAPCLESLLERHSGLANYLFRGCGADRLSSVVKSGCDVAPTNSPLFAGPLTKALEYGCKGDQIIQIYHSSRLNRSWRDEPTSISSELMVEIKKDYPTELITTDSKWYLFSKFPLSDTRTGTPYEREYGYWIPGDAFEALQGVIIIVENLEEFARRAQTSLLPD